MHAPDKNNCAKIVRKTGFASFLRSFAGEKKINQWRFTKKMFGAVALSYAGIGPLHGIAAPATKAACSRYFR